MLSAIDAFLTRFRDLVSGLCPRDRRRPRRAAVRRKGGLNSIQPDALKEWLTYIASDELQGRQIYTEGLGLAAAYIADHLKEWGVKPAATTGRYFQTVKVVGVRTTSRASVTVDVNGQRRTFKDGEGHHLPEEHGREADDHRRSDPVRRLRPADSRRRASTTTRRSIRRGRSSSSSAPGRRPAERDELRRLLIGAQPRGDREGRGRGDRAGRRLRVRRRGAAAAPNRRQLRQPAQRLERGGQPAARRSRRRRGQRRRRARRSAGHRRLHDRAALRQAGSAGGHRRGRVLRVPLQRLRHEVRRAEGKADEAGAAAALRAEGRQDHDQRRRRLRRRQHAPHAATSSASSRAAIRS